MIQPLEGIMTLQDIAVLAANTNDKAELARLRKLALELIAQADGRVW